MEIKVVSEAEFDGLYGIIEESFPYEERRDREDERREIKRKEFNFCRLVSGKETVGIVTNNFHAYRAFALARRLGYERVLPVPCGCPPVLFVNYMVREFFAVWKMWLSR